MREPATGTKPWWTQTAAEVSLSSRLGTAAVVVFTIEKIFAQTKQFQRLYALPRRTQAVATVGDDVDVTQSAMASDESLRLADGRM